MPLNTRLVIFDWDGTLFDSVAQIVKSLCFAAEQNAQPLTPEAAKSVIGLGLPEVMHTLFPQVPHLHDAITQSYKSFYPTLSAQDKWFDGVATMLHDLKQKNTLLAVATGKNRAGLDRVLKQTQSTDLFCITRAASETQSKPHPQMLEEILAYTGVKPAQAIMVGDSSYDLEMAQRLKMPRIGVSYGVHHEKILAQYQPLSIEHNVTNLHHTLKRYIG